MGLRFSIDSGLGTITLDRKEKANALDIGAFRELEEIVQKVREDRTIKGLLVTAEGSKAFCAGADINDLVGLSAEEADRRATYRRQVLQDFAELPVPSIAVIEALAVGGGVELALACTFRFASATARFSFPEIKLGLLPGAGGTQRLPRVVGVSHALELMLTARMINSEEALALGLVSRIAANALEEARSLAAEWMQYDRDAVSGILAAVRYSELPISAGLVEEGRCLVELSSSHAAAKRIAAFLGRGTARASGT